jgi:hypothetical protein
VKLTCEGYALRSGKARLLGQHVECNDERDGRQARDVPAKEVSHELHGPTNSTVSKIEFVAARFRKLALFHRQVDTGAWRP